MLSRSIRLPVLFVLNLEKCLVISVQHCIIHGTPSPRQNRENRNRRHVALENEPAADTPPPELPYIILITHRTVGN